MDMLYFIVTCEETDPFEGKIIHVNEKARDIEEVHQIVVSRLDKFPAAHWALYPCHIKKKKKNFILFF